jgi:dolichol kinase
MKAEKRFEIRRKVMHLVIGAVLATLAFYDMLDKFAFGWFIIIVFFMFWLSKKVKIPGVGWLIENFERVEIKERFPGKGFLFYMIGAELCIIFFAKEVAIAAILILAIGDSVPNFVGMYFGRVKHPFSNKKFLEGAGAGVVLAAIAASFFVAWYEAFVAAVVAIFVEGIDMVEGLDVVDDNLLVPLAAGIVILAIRVFF